MVVGSNGKPQFQLLGILSMQLVTKRGYCVVQKQMSEIPEVIGSDVLVALVFQKEYLR